LSDSSERRQGQLDKRGQINSNSLMPLQDQVDFNNNYSNKNVNSSYVNNKNNNSIENN